MRFKNLILMFALAFGAEARANQCSWVNAKKIDSGSSIESISMTYGYSIQVPQVNFSSPIYANVPVNGVCVRGPEIHSVTKYEVCAQVAGGGGEGSFCQKTKLVSLARKIVSTKKVCQSYNSNTGDCVQEAVVQDVVPLKYNIPVYQASNSYGENSSSSDVNPLLCFSKPFEIPKCP